MLSTSFHCSSVNRIHTQCTLPLKVQELVYEMGSSLASTRIPVESPAFEVQLVNRIAQVDHDAFADFYDRFSKPLYAFAFRMLNDRAEAEEVLQEAFLKIWKKAGSFDVALAAPFTWVVTVTRNKAIDRPRARDRFRTIQETANGHVDEPPDETHPVEIIRREDAANVRSALNELPFAQRQAIELAFFSGLTHTEIAEALAEPLGTIKARIRRGMAGLRDGLEGRV
jgi:RNA polymerase sigma-70 factor (ECF subfamily)